MPVIATVMSERSETDAQLLLELQPSGEGIILLVEDDDHIAKLITLILGRSRRRVVRARDFAGGLALFAEHRANVDLLIVDSLLPDGDGGQLCQQLRSERPYLPVLLTSGRDQTKASTLHKGGATVFLPKPFLPADVERKVASLLGVLA